jgi:predicted nucleic acid-binding protein
LTWLVDTNVVSEIHKGSRCHPLVAAWWASVEESALHLSALTLGEIRKGIETVRPRDPTKAQILARWLAEVETAFGARVLPVDSPVTDRWGQMMAVRSVPAVDCLLAATAAVHGLVLVTRNDAHVAGLGVDVLNPFAPVP